MMTDRELIEALEDALLSALPFVEDAERDPCYKPAAVRKVLAQVRAALKAAPIRWGKIDPVEESRHAH